MSGLDKLFLLHRVLQGRHPPTSVHYAVSILYFNDKDLITAASNGARMWRASRRKHSIKNLLDEAGRQYGCCFVTGSSIEPGGR